MALAVLNVHEWMIPGSVDAVGRMIDTLGAAGGHGPIRYRVESYERGRRVRFRFLSPEGFVGTHGLVLVRKSGGNRRHK